MSIDKFVNVISVITQHTINENTLTSRRGSRKMITLMKVTLTKDISASDLLPEKQ